MSARSRAVGPGPLRRMPTTPVRPTPVVDLVAQRLEPLRDDARGAVLGEGEFRVFVQVPVDVLEIGENVGRAHGGGSKLVGGRGSRPYPADPRHVTAP